MRREIDVENGCKYEMCRRWERCTGAWSHVDNPHTPVLEFIQGEDGRTFKVCDEYEEMPEDIEGELI